MNANEGIDGQFGPVTASALKMVGYPEDITGSTFNQIVSKANAGA